jgi:allantoinase
MTVDLVVKGGYIVDSEFVYKAAIAIDEGKIVAIGSDESMPSATRTIDVHEMFVLPGIIDEHVHFREPGLEYKEDFLSGSMAAVAGGVTSVGDMPNVNPPTQDAASFKLKLQKGLEKSLVDFAIYGVVLPTNIDKIQELKEAGVIGFKIFMGETVGNLPSPDDWELIESFREIAKTGLRVGVHAENRSINAHLASQFINAGKNDPIYHLLSRPSISEAEAIQRAILFAKYSKAKLHIFHMSSAEGVDIIRMAKREGVDVTAETCPHYLLLDGEEGLRKMGSLMKMNPPVRTLDHAEALWRGLKDGTIDTIASDHSPHSNQEKFNANIWKAIAGWPGVETLLPLMLTEVNRGRLSLNEIVRYMSEKPARVWGFYPQKGRIGIGSDGDLTVVDLKKEWTIRAENLHSKSKFTPFDGWKVKGSIEYTIIRGDVLFEQGQITPDGHKARLITPQRN